ncbi:MAG: polysaccharide biosynthesis tyrosine autokinase [Desulfoplanes sp.]
MENSSSDILEIDIRDYLRTMFKYRWTIITCFLLVFVSVAIYTFTATPIYQASAQLIIEKDNPNILSIEEVLSVDSSGTDYYQTQYKIIESRSLARKVIQKLHLETSEEFFPAPKEDFFSTMKQSVGGTLQTWKAGIISLFKTDGDAEVPQKEASDQGLVNTFLSRLTVEPVRNSRLVFIRFEARDPRMAANIVNALAQAYIDQGMEAKLEASQNAVKWLDDRVQEERGKVEAAELKLQRYKEKNSIITDFSNDSENITAQKLAELNSQVVEAETRRVEAQTRYEQTLRLINQPSMLDSIPEILNNSLVQRIKTDEVDLSKHFSELSKKYGPRHPQIVALKAEMRTLDLQRKAEIKKVVNSLKNEYEVSQAREDSVKRALVKIKKEALGLNKKAIEYGVLSREAESSRQMYDLLIKRFKETALTEDIKTGNVRIVDRAEVPQGPIKPKKQLNLLLALIVGLTLGVGLAFFLEFMDNTLKTPDDIKRFLKIPYLAPIPYYDLGEPGGGPYSRELITQHFPKSTASEAYRGLRTSLLFSSADAPPQVIMITSAGPGEGKTLTSSNLAATMAQSGSKVILLDCDLRRPRMHKIFNLNRDMGISNILAGSMEASELVTKTDIENLSVIPSGPIPPNPSELLGSQRMRKLIEVLRQHYDRVIIDSSPITAVTDASVLSDVVDGVVFVVRSGHTVRDVVKNALDSLHMVKAKVLGAVLNGVNVGKEGYYYYQYNYYYYGEDGERKKKTRKQKRASKVYGGHKPTA